MQTPTLLSSGLQVGSQMNGADYRRFSWQERSSQINVASWGRTIKWQNRKASIRNSPWQITKIITKEGVMMAWSIIKGIISITWTGWGTWAEASSWGVNGNFRVILNWWVTKTMMCVSCGQGLGLDLWHPNSPNDTPIGQEEASVELVLEGI